MNSSLYFTCATGWSCQYPMKCYRGSVVHILILDLLGLQQWLFQHKQREHQSLYLPLWLDDTVTLACFFVCNFIAHATQFSHWDW